ncbi:MAG: type IV secretion system protein [Candidatus Microsaccharimonas sp.]
MSVFTYKHISLIKFVLLIIGLAFTGSLVFSSSVGATAMPAKVLKIISDAQYASGDRMEQLVNDFHNEMNTQTFTVCTNSANYKSGAVNGKDGGGSFASYLKWTNDGAGEYSNDWINKTSQLLRLLNGEVGGDMSLEYTAEGNNEGWCSYIVRMATEAKIPISAKAVTVNNDTDTKSAAVSDISNKCSAEFSAASNGAVGSPTTIATFLNELSTNDYRTVEKYALAITGQSSASTQCSQLVNDLKPQIDAKVASICEQNANATGCPGGENGTDSGTTSCGIEGVGWIVCPVLTFLGGIADNAFSFLSTTFLETKASVLSDASIRAAWSAIRNIANVAFVIAFLIIIFSQLTGQGVSNYGVKKLLPRLIIAAILVNASFFICQIAVDISNVLGYSISEILNSTYLQIQGDLPPEASGASSNGFGWAVIITAVIAGAVTLALTITVPVLLAALLALLMIVLILVARTALIILLTIIAPLAFVAFLFPNTEQWFKKWYKMFFALLILFPVIAIVFSASSLAAKVINDAANGDILMQVVAIGVATIPLFVVPGLLKRSLEATGTIGTKLSGLSSKLDGRIGGKIRDTSKFGQLQKYRGQQSQIRRAKILGGQDPRRGGGANPLNWGARASKAFNESRVSGQFGTRAAQMGEAIVHEEFEKQVKEAAGTQSGLSMAEVTAMATTGKDSNGRKLTEASRAAAVDKVMTSGGFGDRRKVLEAMASQKSTTTTQLRKRAVDAAYAKGDSNIYGVKFGDNIIQSGGAINSSTQLADAAVKNARDGSVSAEHLLHSEGATEYLVDEVLSRGDTTARSNLARSANAARTGQNTRSKVTKNFNDQFGRL